MTNEILGRENKSIKAHAINVINNPDFYNKEEVKNVYNNVSNDKRINLQTKMELLDGLRKVYKHK